MLKNHKEDHKDFLLNLTTKMHSHFSWEQERSNCSGLSRR